MSRFSLRGLVLTAFLAQISAATVTAETVMILPNYVDGANEGFNDPTLGNDRRAALEFAMGIWGNALQASYMGETVTMEVRFDPLGGDANSATLGFAGPTGQGFVSGNPQGPNVFFVGGVRNHLEQSDVVAGSEMTGTFNSDVDGTTVLGSNMFYYGTDGMGGPGTVDFVEVALHEIGHGLGFTGTLRPQLANGSDATQEQLNMGEGTQADYSSGAFYNSFDNHVIRKSDGMALASLSTTDRYNAVVADDIAWNGAAGVAANGGTPIDLEGTYSSAFGGVPAGTWILGSTYSHVDEDDYPLELMSPIATNGTGFEIDPFTRGILSDIGWTVTVAIPEPSAGIVFIIGSALYAGRRRHCRLI